MATLGSKPITADDDTREFIRGLEMTARKVQLSSKSPTCGSFLSNRSVPVMTDALQHVHAGSHQCKQKTDARTPTPAELGEKARGQS